MEDLRGLLWSSIDNPDSMDLDQLEWAETHPDGRCDFVQEIAAPLPLRVICRMMGISKPTLYNYLAEAGL